MVNTNGWTQHEYKRIKELRITGNWENIVWAYNQFAQEIGTRNVNKGIATIRKNTIQENEAWVQSGVKPCGHGFKHYCDCDNYLRGDEQ